ncbi:hypothetical protein [Rhabdaerophilum sp.]|uniref:hypothetical protein n=1 Tax=Rhabdaerophilum sp. TaxID=2717341 RepID=UPI0038D366B0
MGRGWPALRKAPDYALRRRGHGGISRGARTCLQGWRAGYVQLGVDCAILLASPAVLPPQNFLLSLLGAVVVNLILAINHRPGRYLGMS